MVNNDNILCSFYFYHFFKGPCQFPTLGFIVERYLERKNFVKESFWKLSLELKKGEEIAQFFWERDKLFDKLATMVIYESCLEGNPVAKIILVEQKRKTNQKPLPLTTITMQKELSKYLRISSEKTMEIAERLYQQGFFLFIFFFIILIFLNFFYLLFFLRYY
jgi:DNA topoisomerase III